MTTIRDLLQEKFEHFIKLLESIFSEKELEHISQLYKNIKTELIVEFIKLKIIPFKFNYDLIIHQLITDFKLDVNKLTDDHKIKFKKYLDFFIEIVDHIEKL